MNGHFIEATVAVAGIFAVAVVLHDAPVRDFLYESAMRGGTMSARATESVGNIAAIMSATKP